MEKEISRRWATRKYEPTRSEVDLPMPGGKEVVALVHHNVPLLVESPVSGKDLGAEAFWHVGFDAVACKVKVGRRVAAFLRPLTPQDLRDIRPEEVLDCLSRGFPENRDQAILALENADTRRFLIKRRDLLLAHLGSLPPASMADLPAVSEEEMKMLSTLRMRSIVSQEMLCNRLHGTQPVSFDEIRMLESLRSAGITRESLDALLLPANEPVAE